MEAGLHNEIISVSIKEFTVLGRIQDFREGGSKYGPPKAILGVRGILSRKRLRTSEIGFISSILRPSQSVIISIFLNLGGSTGHPEPPPS